jgi:transcriptional regulator with XRE-family HTH domain
MNFPTRLRQVRLERKLTQEQLGKKINVTKVSVSCYEKGTRTPDMETLQRLADALEISTDFLLGRSDDPETAGAGEVVVKADQADPETCNWLKELVNAPKECRDELRKIWDIIKNRGNR